MTVEPEDLATSLNDVSINEDRAQHFIDRAVTLCQSIINPLPDEADVVVERVAARAYFSTTSARQYQLDAAEAAFGTQPGPVGGVYLTRADKADLRRLSGGGGAFSIDLLPTDYVAPLPIDLDLADWDTPP